MKLQNSNLVVRAIWAVLLVAFVAALALLSLSLVPLGTAAALRNAMDA